MRAARMFALRLEELGLLERTTALRIESLGSLGATGRGHGTDRAAVLGLDRPAGKPQRLSRDLSIR